ncbi:hypothetical protein Nepgr_023302 [Nepenthes gracilis]|uniref:Uncharacterized protein n=1 Tax=Nepenthes gracilis TaxID=150966 RepID=A0AAD3T270_NEPGR|nr:hypothetical protein Nepgr_023302 [Nepenthes gracilis]
MGNCQAVDAATMAIQHPSGRVDKLYSPVPASEIMKVNPGHHVALLITTTVYHPVVKSSGGGGGGGGSSNNENSSRRAVATTIYHPTGKKENHNKNDNESNSSNRNNETISSRSSPTACTTARSNTVRITRVKLLRPTDTLTLGHVYRLISTQEVKKQNKTRKNGFGEEGKGDKVRDAETVTRRSQLDIRNQVKFQVIKQERHRSRAATAAAPNASTSKPRTWRPSLRSISEAGS